MLLWCFREAVINPPMPLFPAHDTYSVATTLLYNVVLCSVHVVESIAWGPTMRYLNIFLLDLSQ